jgi:hypothetical protein
MKRAILLRVAIAAASVAMLQACNEPDPATRSEEGLYGSSSGPNPNLADLQQDSPSTTAPGPAETPSSPRDNAYPSQAGEPAGAGDDPGAGRSSAETGATEGQTP